MKSRVVCAYCTVIFDAENGAINRAKKSGLNLYCSRACSGLGRQSTLTTDQRKAEKAKYDAEYRSENREKLRRKKAAYHKNTYDPIAAAKRRKIRMPYHVEYCRRPDYRQKKQAYDQEYRAKNEFGPFWESHILQLAIRRESLAQMSETSIRAAKGTLNKKQTRRRDYEAAFRSKSEVGALGNLERSQGR